MTRALCLCSMCAGLLLAVSLPSTATDRTITVASPDCSYRNAIVRVSIPAPAAGLSPVLRDGSQVIPSQVVREASGAQLVFVLPEMKQGQSKKLRLSLAKQALPGAGGVEVKRVGDNVDILVGGELFARYDTSTGPNKPYFHPMYAPGNHLVVRQWPLKDVPGEEHDHPHHRGMWFTHGAVNGEDYWTEGDKTARTVHTGYEVLQSGAVCGGFRASTKWISREGAEVMTDRRTVTVYDTPGGRTMDLTIELKAGGKPVTLGDTKEGTFGIRVAETMRLKGGSGHIVSSTGLKDGDTWGKRAEWVDYYGPVDGAQVGIAVLDSPTSFRHPTWWHVRDYGLFAVNPFGLHDFDRSQKAGAGDFVIAAGGTLTFRYRIYVHTGTATDAAIADVWNAYSRPLKVTVR